MNHYRHTVYLIHDLPITLFNKKCYHLLFANTVCTIEIRNNVMQGSHSTRSGQTGSVNVSGDLLIIFSYAVLKSVKNLPTSYYKKIKISHRINDGVHPYEYRNGIFDQYMY